MRRSLSGRGWSPLSLLPLVVAGACSTSVDTVVAPVPVRPSFASVPLSSTSGVVISQVYGGGGNGGSFYKNDFIELYNGGADTVNLAGSSVQYASATGSSWTNKTDLTGKIAPGGFYLVQQAAGTTVGGGSAPLPTPDQIGAISMSGTVGKVALVASTTALTGTCPLGGAVIDFVGYGTGASGANCSEGGTPVATLSNANSAQRKPLAAGGFQDTNVNGTDFTVAAANPRSGGSPPPPPPTAGPLARVVITGGSRVSVGTPLQLTAQARDSANAEIAGATFTWTTSDAGRATVDNTGRVTAVTPGGFVTISATTTVGGITRTGSVTLVVSQGGSVSVSARADPLPVGFQTQLFASGTDASGNTVSNVTWASSNPAKLTVDSRGVITAIDTGSAAIAVFTADGSAGSTTVTVQSQLFANNVRVEHDTEFGTPTDADASDDVIIARKQYTLSYNPQRGGPNWVSWDLSTTHLGSTDRCNCFTADTALTRLGFPAYTTADYITGGLYDRGHMHPSADETTTNTENGTTFFLTNVLPQKNALNAGPWARLEEALRDSARAGREVYQIAGGVFTNGVGLGSLNGLGKIFIPDSTWKIVVFVKADSGLAQVARTADLNVIAVNMPNVDGIASVNWQTYLTTVQKIQQSTGYDFLAALPEAIECRVEVRNCLPQAEIATPATVTAGQATTLSLSWQDADGTTDAPFKVVIEWGDGTSVTGTYLSAYPSTRPLARQKMWSVPGTYVVKVTITDKRGGTSVTTKTVVVS